MRRRLSILAALAAALSLGTVALAQGPAPRGPGVVVERVRAPIAPEVPVGDRQITIVRVDLARYRLRILTAEHDGGPRTAPRWVADHHLAGVINAGMFLPNLRSVGHMVRDGAVVSSRRVTKYRGILGFGPRRRGVAPLAIGGRRCGDSIDSMRRDYDNVLQAFEMVDCRGEAHRWPSRKRYSAAGLGVDEDGRAVFVHVRTPYRMAVLDRMLADDRLRIRSMIYMEGGPEASLVVDAEGARVSEMGSYETGFNENDDNRRFWELPNVIAFAPR